ncbi:TetR family transcriptional regulator [Streptomyces sp. ISL-90]|nr:TetR family transcriptional regulator [Streptomyces sp. ISL-90]
MTAHKTPDAPAPLSRKERAGRTRARILTAARAEFTAKGYHATTMAAIAAGAGVAVQTVYFVFGTKPALLQELLGVAVMGQSDDGLPVQRPEDSDWFREALESSDGRGALASFVRGSMPVYSRAAAVAETARVAAQTDPDVADVYTQAESRRVEEFGRVIRALADHDALRTDLTIAQATAVLTTEFGPQSYLSYTAGHGWTDAALAEWMSDALARLLLR